MNEGDKKEQESYAVYFTEGDEDKVIPVSELSEEERNNGGFLLVNPGISSQWALNFSSQKFQVKGGIIRNACNYSAPVEIKDAVGLILGENGQVGIVKFSEQKFNTNPSAD